MSFRSFVLALLIVACLFLALFLARCTPAALPAVQDASAKRDAICRFAQSWGEVTPELEQVRQLCAADADLKAIAAAYAGCSSPEQAPPN